MVFELTRAVNLYFTGILDQPAVDHVDPLTVIDLLKKDG